MLIPLQKADAAQRLIFAQIDETPDRAGEIFDYASSKPYFEEWSKGFSDATAGKSLGNIRAMHKLVMAGKVVDIAFDDAAKAIRIKAHVVDDDEWAKVEAGLYTGISPSGKYVRRWKDGKHTRYTAKPREISLVDLPCNPSSQFTLVKADGADAEIAFTIDEAEQEFAKIGKRHSARDSATIQAMHDHACALGAVCGDDDDAEKGAMADDLLKADLGEARDRIEALSDELQKAETATAQAHDELTKVSGELAGAKDELAKFAKDNDVLRARIAALEAEPSDIGSRTRTVTKTGDADGLDDQIARRRAEIDKMPEGSLQRAQAEMALAILSPKKR